MKKMLFVSLALLYSASALAAGRVGDCLYPKTVPVKGGRLEFAKSIEVYATPDKKNPTILKSLSGYLVTEQKGGLVKIATVPNYELPNPDSVAGKEVGWVNFKDFRILDGRNCR